MMESTNRPVLSKLFRLQWEPAQDAYVLLYPEGMVKLSQSASEILKRCDGNSTTEAIILDLEKVFSFADLRDEVCLFLNEAYTRGWLV